MSEEEKNEETVAEESAPEDAPAEEPAAEEAPAEQAPAEEAEAEQAPAAEAEAEHGGTDPAAPGGEAEEAASDLSPKARRKRRRSLHVGDAREPRTPEERAAERRAVRRAKAEARRRARGRELSRHQAGRGTPPAERRPGSKKVRQGTVVSNAAEKTITVRIEVVRRHPTYEKIVRQTATIHAHDEGNEANPGDVVRVIESRPLSRTKRWRLVEVLERAR